MDYLTKMYNRYPELENIKEDMEDAYEALCSAYENGGKLLVCGNGGSASDSEHIVGELMKGFYKKRCLEEGERELYGEMADSLQGALPAISLTGHPALSTAFSNDVNPEMVFAQQVYGYGKEGDVLVAISTSGNSKNVVNAVNVAKIKKMKTIAFTGAAGGTLNDVCDVCLKAPSTVTADVQEFHLPIYHTLCAMLEEKFFPGE